MEGTNWTLCLYIRFDMLSWNVIYFAQILAYQIVDGSCPATKNTLKVKVTICDDTVHHLYLAIKR
jgi:hypothetical protein